MRRAALLALSVLLAPASWADEAPWWVRTWRYGEILGRPAARASLVEVLSAARVEGIALTQDRLTDPLGGDCASGVRYDDIVPRGRLEIGEHFGQHWRLPPELETPGTVAGWVRCGPDHGNLAAVAFVRPGLGYRFFEDGLVLTLR